MKEQYVGDVNDYRKYALLRHLARKGGVRIGVCWMLTPPDAGNLRHYLSDADRWREYDADLFDQLHAVIGLEGVSRLAAIERSGIIPDAGFFNAVLTDKTDRRTYFNAALEHLAIAELVFFDPDNGVAPGLPKKTIAKRASKFIYLNEIAAAYERNHSVLIYQHFPRVPRDQFIQKLGSELAEVAPTAQLWCFRTPFAVFLLLAHPRHAALVVAAENTPAHWRPRFIDAKRLAGK